MSLHGLGIGFSAANRWFDKTLQVSISLPLNACGWVQAPNPDSQINIRIYYGAEILPTRPNLVPNLTVAPTILTKHYHPYIPNIVSYLPNILTQSKM